MMSRIGSRIRSLRYGRNLRAYGRRAGLPYGIIDPLIKSWKLALAPSEFARRHSTGKALLRRVVPPIVLSSESAYAKFERGTFRLAEPVIAACERLYEIAIPKIDLSDPKNRFRHNLLTKDNITDQKEILDFVLSDDVVAAATRYLGLMPVLGSVQLWWTPVNETTIGSQLYHIDQVDRRQFKIFLNIRPVSDRAGPLTFLPANASERIFRQVADPYDRLTDEEVRRHSNRGEEVAFTGAVGEGGIIDSCRCYHYGGRAREEERLVLMVQYYPYHCVKETSDVQWQRMVGRIRDTRVRTNHLDQLLTLPPSPFLRSEQDDQ